MGYGPVVELLGDRDPLIVQNPKNREVTRLEGLHLYHYAGSNCAMRVRMTLIEKGLEWESHHLDITKGEHITPEFFGINPKGLVPTLVHDGVVHIESNDIIQYLDETWPEPPLQPTDPRERAEMDEWLRLSGSIHVSCIKTYIYARKIGSRMQKSEEEIVRYRSLQTDEELLAFHAKSSATGFDENEVREVEDRLKGIFAKLDRALTSHEWVVGDRFSLADISWVPLHFTLVGAQFPFESFPQVQRWAAAVRERPSFQRGVLEWVPDFGKL